MATAGPEFFWPVSKLLTQMVLPRTLRQCLRYFNASVDVNSSLGVFSGPVGFVCAFEEY